MAVSREREGQEEMQGSGLMGLVVISAQHVRGIAEARAETAVRAIRLRGAWLADGMADMPAGQPAVAGSPAAAAAADTNAIALDLRMSRRQEEEGGGLDTMHMTFFPANLL